MKFAVALVLAVFVAAAAGAAVQDPFLEGDSRHQRIVGGSTTTINQYPYSAAMLHNDRGRLPNYIQWCGGTVLTQRTLLSAAHCLVDMGIWHQAVFWRTRLGSTFASSGGIVYNIDSYIRHPQYAGNDYDVVVLRTATPIVYNINVGPASIAGPNYNLADNEVVWAIGWGVTAASVSQTSEQLRHVQIWTVNQAQCRERYGVRLTDNMLCSGRMGVGGRDQCQGDSGSPLIHNGVIVGVCSFGQSCALPNYPGVNARVSSFSGWIQSTSFLLGLGA